ncbi:MAG: hypothetical protein K2Y37_21445 [Pirellulales bacterium]|nr:hypothetical protein [Pirellulales bacterium]
MIAFVRPNLEDECDDAALQVARRTVADVMLSPARAALPAPPATWKCWLLVAWMSVVAATACCLLLLV